MGQHEIPLQQLELPGGNVGLRQPAEAGIDAIRTLAAFDDVGHGLRAAVYGTCSGVGQRQAGAAARQITQGGEIDGIADLEHRAMMPEGGALP